MRARLYQSRLQALIARRNGYLVLAVGLLLLCVLLTLLTLCSIGRERIIITPAVVQRPFWVDSHQVSAEYLAQMSSFFAQLRLTVTPSSATWQRETLLRYTDPSFYGVFKSALLVEADHLNSNHLTLAFYPVDIQVDAVHLSAILTGDLIRTVGNQPMPAQRVRYRLGYRYVQGQLWLESFSTLH